MFLPFIAVLAAGCGSNNNESDPPAANIAGGNANDLRLACHGLDRNDNDFVVGLIGPRLHPLSAVVQEMRKTEQTAQYLDSLGPFFIGKVVWQSAMPGI